MKNQALIEALQASHTLRPEEFEQLFSTYTKDDLAFAMERARALSIQNFGRKIFFRGIIEFTNYCKNGCYYCGIRSGNACVGRYRLGLEDILLCCEEGYQSGFRTFVLQGGEDSFFTDARMVEIVRAIRESYPDCAITLSIGERSRASYQQLFDAGADRYLLRHETASSQHYAMLHPAELSLENRLRCLRDLKQIGYQTGCGCMIGTPGQTPAALAEDMCLMQTLAPEMIGLGPFLPHKDTPFRDEPAGSVETTLFMIALCRLMLPFALIPSTTALGTAEQDGRKLGVLAGCNVVMPNLSPLAVRKKYMLYDNKAGTDMTAAQGIALLSKQMQEIGYEVVTGRGDFQKEARI